MGSNLIRQFEGGGTKSDEALDKISKVIKEFIDTNSTEVAIAKVQFDVFGFSRGEAAGEVRFLGLFDTVAAIGSLLNFYGVNGRSNLGVNLELRPSVAQKVFQISAMHECRYNFSLNSIAGMWSELLLPLTRTSAGVITREKMKSPC